MIGVLFVVPNIDRPPAALFRVPRNFEDPSIDLDRCGT
jgi:hypothetical protein